MIQRVILVGLLLALLTSAPRALANPDQPSVRLLPAQTVREAAFPPEREVPLELDASGSVGKFLDGWWVLETHDYDVDGNGTIDYTMFVAVRDEHVARVVRAYGADPDAFGPVVFYLIRNGRGDIAEWAGDPTWPHHPSDNPGLKSRTQEDAL